MVRFESHKCVKMHLPYPGPSWGSLQCSSSRPASWIWGKKSVWKGRETASEGKERKVMEKREIGGEETFWFNNCSSSDNKFWPDMSQLPTLRSLTQIDLITNFGH